MGADVRQCKLRRALLAELATPCAPRDILDAFMSPIFEQIKTGADDGWASYLRVLPRLGEDERWLELLAKHFDGVAREFIAALRWRVDGLVGQLWHNRSPRHRTAYVKFRF